MLHVVVITGMSGAGRSTALRVLEDVGFFCVDNLPPALAPELFDRLEHDQEIHRAGLGIDVRTGDFLEGAEGVFEDLRASGYGVEIVFLDASDEALVHRFSETRRPHPLAPGGDLLHAILRERERLAGLRALANLVVDTTELSVHDLRRRLVDHVARGGVRPRMVTRVVSFGFKFGIPVDADIVLDVRHLPNPYFVDSLRPKTGLDPEVSRYVLEAADTMELLRDTLPMLSHVIPHHERSGKAYLTLAIGCTGGQHRSVAVAEEIARFLRSSGEILVSHRDSSGEILVSHRDSSGEILVSHRDRAR